MARTTPLCSVCNREHWNFTPCGEIRQAPDVVRQERNDGLAVWGDRLETVDRQGTTFFLKDQTTSSDTLTGPEGWTPPN